MRLPPGGASASYTMFVVAANGTAMGSGSNSYGQLGHGGTSSVPTAGPLPELGGDIVHVARGNHHTLVLKLVVMADVPSCLADMAAGGAACVIHLQADVVRILQHLHDVR